MKIYLIRHGQTDWNKERRWQGQTDIAMNDIGRAQAKALSELVGDWDLVKIITSDLSRAIETGKIAIGDRKIPLESDKRFREGHFGEAEGMVHEEVIQKYGDEFLGRWRGLETRHQDLGFPGGETRRQTRNRFREAMAEVAAAHPNEAVGVVSHGSVIKQFLKAEGHDVSVYKPIPNCSAFELSYDPESDEFSVQELHRCD